MLKIATITLQFAFISLVSSNEPVCDPDSSVTNSGTPMSPTFSQEATIRFFSLNSQYQMFYSQSQIRVDVIGTKASARIYPATDELLVIDGDKCSATKLSDSSSIYNAVFHNARPLAQIFRLENVSKMIYHGKARTNFWPRDLDIWSRCLRVTKTSIANVTYYLEIDKKIARPVQAIIIYGKSQNITIQVIEYTNFIVDQPATFAIPRHVVCERSRAILDVSQLGNHFYYEEEIIQPSLKTFAYNKIWHYHDEHLTRIDFNRKGKFSQVQFSQILDFGHAIVYSISRNDKGVTCDRKRLDMIRNNHEIGGLTSKDGLVVLANSLQIFESSKNDFYYQGEEQVKGVLCEVYRSRRNITHDNKTVPGTVTLYVLHPTWAKRTDDVTKSRNITPVTMIVTHGQIETWYVYFKFTRNLLDFSAFDTTPCLRDSHVLSLVFTIPGRRVSEYVDQLRDQTRKKVKEAAGIDARRIQNIHIWQDHTSFYIRVSILDTDSYIACFVPVESHYIPGPVTLTLHGVPDIETCAARCAHHQRRFCVSISFCRKQRLCLLNKSRLVNSTLSRTGHGSAAIGTGVDGVGKGSTNTDCKHLLRRYSNLTNPPLLSEVYRRLSSAVDEGRINFTLVYHGHFDDVLTTLQVKQIKIEDGSLELEALPEVPTRVAYRIEIHAPRDNPQLITKHIYYDNERRVLQITTHYPFLPKKRRVQTIIADFASDERYKIYEETGDCRVEKPHKISMFDHPLHFFNDSTGYTMIGQKNIAEVLCTIFKSTNPLLIYGKLRTVHYLIASRKYLRTKSSHQSRAFLPVQIQGFGIHPKDDFTIDIFDVETEFDESYLSISSCFHSNAKIRLILTFPVKENFKLEHRLSTIHALRSYLMRNMSLPKLAAADDIITTDSRNLYYSITLLYKERSGRDGLNSLYTELVNNVYRSYVTLKIQYALGQGAIRRHVVTTHTTAVSISKVDDLRKPTNLQPAVQMRRFVEAIPHLSETSVEGWGGKLAVDGCAHHCVEVSWMDCHSFMYCFDKHDCIIFNERRATKRQYGRDCRFYIRKFIDDYTFVGGAEIILDGDASSAKRVDNCAKSCTDRSWHCKRFSYCRETGTCVLSGTREGALTTNDHSAECLSYSRNYLSDFAKVSGRLRGKAESAVLYGLSPSRCAQKCALTGERGCVEFDFCNSTDGTECFLYAKDASFTDKTIESVTCDRYIAQVASGTTTGTMNRAAAVPTTTLSQNATTSKLSVASEETFASYSPGEMVGLAVGVFLIGVLITIAVVKLVRCFQSAHGNMPGVDMAVFNN